MAIFPADMPLKKALSAAGNPPGLFAKNDGGAFAPNRRQMRRTWRICLLLQVFLNGFFKFFNGLHVPIFHRVGDAVGNMLVNDLLAKAVESGPCGGDLHQDRGTVLIVFDHLLDVLQMSNDTRKTVQLPLFFLRIMKMPVFMVT